MSRACFFSFSGTSRKACKALLGLGLMKPLATARACLRREAVGVRLRWFDEVENLNGSSFASFVNLRRVIDDGGCVVLDGMLGTVCDSVFVEQLFTDDGGESAMRNTANVARTDIARGFYGWLEPKWLRMTNWWSFDQLVEVLPIGWSR